MARLLCCAVTARILKSVPMTIAPRLDDDNARTAPLAARMAAPAVLTRFVVVASAAVAIRIPYLNAARTDLHRHALCVRLRHIAGGERKQHSHCNQKPFLHRILLSLYEGYTCPSAHYQSNREILMCYA